MNDARRQGYVGDVVLADLEFMEQRRENLKRGQALVRESYIEWRVKELKEKKIGKLEWWQTEEREQILKAQYGFEEREQMKKEEREQDEKRRQAGPGVAPPIGVETRKMKKARMS